MLRAIGEVDSLQVRVQDLVQWATVASKHTVQREVMPWRANGAMSQTSPSRSDTATAQRCAVDCLALDSPRRDDSCITVGGGP
jgi:hypothetical protein